MAKIKTFRWVVEFTVDETWVADGFNLTDETATEMLAHELSGVIGHHVYAVNADDPTTEIEALKHEHAALRQLLTKRDARIAELEPSRDEWERAWHALRQDSSQQLEVQSITYQDNLTEIQMLKTALEQIYAIVHEGYGTGNDRCEAIIQNALAPPHRMQ